MKRVYMDNASHTPIRPEVEKEIVSAWKNFGNAGSVHSEGVRAKKILDESRRKCALVLNCRPDEIIFTSGGTESNNLAILGIANQCLKSGQKIEDLHFICSAIEHSSVLEIFTELKKRGASVTFAPVKSDGQVDLEALKKAILPNTVLVSVMTANNEIGAIEPLRKISKIISEANESRANKIVFHTDASQAPLYLDINRNNLRANLITIDGQKINGPLGVGLLYKERGIELSPIMFGGGQERGLRPGTENIPLIAGLAKALELASKNRKREAKRLAALKSAFIKSLLKKIPGADVNGSVEESLPNIINLYIPGLDAEFVVLQLDAKGYACSTRSACLDDETGSHVLRALGKPERVKSSLRFSFGSETKMKDVAGVVALIAKISKE